MRTYNELADDLAILAKDQDWKMVRSWFSYWDSLDEQVFKCLIWLRFFLPHYFRDETPEFHLDLIKRYLSDKNEYTACPRGFAKTTINQGCISFEVASGLQKFIVVIEKNFTEASEVLFAVRDEFENNPMLVAVYGKLVKKDAEGVFDDKNKDAQGDVFIGGIRLRAKGFNTPIRGLKSKEWRPTKIIVDDVEEDEHVRNEDQRRKYRENFAQGILPSLDIGGTVKVTGTILHNDSLLKNLIEQHGGRIYRAFDPIDPENTLLWGQRWTYPLLMEKKSQMEMEGKGSSKFFQEYLNEPVDDERRAFKMEWLQKTYTEEDLKFRATKRYAVIDTADSLNQGTDFTGLDIVDWDSENNWFIQHVKRHKVNVTGLIDLIFEVWLVWKPVKIGVEKKAFEDQVKPLLKIRSQETNIYPVVVELEHGGRRKEDRVRGALQGRFESGKVFFKQNATDDTIILKGELYDFPAGKNDDLCDGLAYIEQIGSRPFSKNKEQKPTLEQEFFKYKKGKMSSLASKL